MWTTILPSIQQKLGLVRTKIGRWQWFHQPNWFGMLFTSCMYEDHITFKTSIATQKYILDDYKQGQHNAHSLQSSHEHLHCWRTWCQNSRFSPNFEAKSWVKHKHLLTLGANKAKCNHNTLSRVHGCSKHVL